LKDGFRKRRSHGKGLIVAKRQHENLAIAAMEVTVTRNNKGQHLIPPEEWAPGRTLYSITEVLLTGEDISDAEQLIGVSNDQIRAKLMEALQPIARRYWEQQRNRQRPPAKWYRTKIQKIREEAQGLLKLLREPQGTALGQLRFRTKQRMGLDLRGSYGQDSRSIEQLLDEFAAVCKSCTFRSARGRPKKGHIKTAVDTLREVWIDFTGKKFPRNFTKADNRKDHNGQPAADQRPDVAFTSPAPRFVQLVMQRIDSSIHISEIETALRAAPVDNPL
jgi:hypothetical protein